MNTRQTSRSNLQYAHAFISEEPFCQQYKAGEIILFHLDTALWVQTLAKPWSFQ